jgi:hypothetical protein
MRSWTTPSVSQPRLPRRARAIGQRWRRQRLDPAPILIEGSGANAAAPAYLSPHSQGEYVFVTAGRGVQPAGIIIQATDRRSVPPIPGKRLLGRRARRDRRHRAVDAKRPVICSCHFIDEAGSEFASRLALLRSGISSIGATAYASFETSSPRSPAVAQTAAAVEGLEVKALRGADIGPANGHLLAFYQHDTNGGSPI